MANTPTDNFGFPMPAKGDYGDVNYADYNAKMQTADANIRNHTPWYTVGVTAGCATLAAAITTIGSTVATLVIPAGSSQAGGEQTIPATMNLKVDRGGMITVATDTTLVIKGNLEAGDYQIFSITGTGLVHFGPMLSARSGLSAPSRELSLAWWGAVGDGTTDDTAALQAAFSSKYWVSGYIQDGQFTYKGIPHAIYLTSGITIGYSSGSGGIIVLDGCGCTFRQKDSGTGDIITLSGSGQFSLKNFTIQGSAPFVFGYTGLGTVTAVSFQTPDLNWHVGLEVDSKAEVGTYYSSGNTVTYNWYYDGSVLWVFAPTDSGDGYIPGQPRYTFNAIKVTIGGEDTTLDLTDIETMTWQYANYGSGIFSVALAYMENLKINNFDRGIRMMPGEWSSVRNCHIYDCNCAIYCVASVAIAQNCTFDNLMIHTINGSNASYPWTVYYAGQGGNFINMDFEQNRCGLMYLSGPGIIVDGIYSEGIAPAQDNNPTAQYMIELNNIAGGCRISGGSPLAIGTGVGYGPCSIQYIFHFVDVKGVDISSNWFYAGNYLYKIEDSGSYTAGICFRENTINTTAITDGSPVIKLDNNVGPAVTPVQPGLIEWAVSRDYGSGVDRLLEVAVNQANVTLSIDPTTGYQDSRSLKVAFTGSSTNQTSLNYYGKQPASGTWAPVYILPIKSDTAMTLTLNGSDIAVLGDTEWRVFYIQPTSTESCSDGDKTVTISSSAVGNIWLGYGSLKWFSSLPEAVAYIGKWDLAQNSVGSLTVNSIVPYISPSAAYNRSIITANTSTTNVNYLLGGSPYNGQKITVILGEINTALKQSANAFTTYINRIYRYINSSWDATNYYASNYNIFDSTGYVNDCLAFGNANPFTQFSGIGFSLSSACDFTCTLIWEYWNGSSWSTLTTSNTNAFKSTGAQNVLFNPPSDWQPYAYGPTSETAYWVRCRISAYTSGSAGGATNDCTRPYGNMRLTADAGPLSDASKFISVDLVYKDGCWYETSRASY